MIDDEHQVLLDGSGHRCLWNFAVQHPQVVLREPEVIARFDWSEAPSKSIDRTQYRRNERAKLSCLAQELFGRGVEDRLPAELGSEQRDRTPQNVKRCARRRNLREDRPRARQVAAVG